MKLQLFLLAIFLTISKGCVFDILELEKNHQLLELEENHHRKVRQIRPEDVRTISEEEMKMMSPERLAMLNKKYTQEFFKPLK